MERLKKQLHVLQPGSCQLAKLQAGHALEISHLLVRSLRAFLSTGRDGSPLKIEAVCSTRVSYYAAIIDKPAGVRLFLASKRFSSSSSPSSSSSSMHFFAPFHHHYGEVRTERETRHNLFTSSEMISYCIFDSRRNLTVLQ